jgi:hypothetical protein
MSNGFIYVVDAHFIDKIEKNLKKILDPSACARGEQANHYATGAVYFI